MRIHTPKNVQILDCTIRDGGYLNSWNFNKKFVREAYRALSKSGVDIMEIGYICPLTKSDSTPFGIWKFSQNSDIKSAIEGIQGIKLAGMIDYGKISLDKILPAKDSAIDLLRIASHKTTIYDALHFAVQVKNKGYDVALNAMGYANYSKSERKNFLSKIKNTPIDYIYAADSYGSIFPHNIPELIEPLVDLNGPKIGFHPHNNLQMAFANTLESIKCGVHIVDTTLYGMGRGAGNLASEILIYYLQSLQQEKYNVMPLLNFIELYVIPLFKKKQWGYQLPFMISGINKCHPTYISRLMDLKEYNIDDICHAAEIIKKYDSVGFSPDILNDVIEQGLIGEYIPLNDISRIDMPKHTPVTIPYAQRHDGKDFLILANGPTLKTHKHKINALIEKFDPIILGANYLGNMFIPHYHAFNNKNRFTMYVESVSAKSTLLCSQYFDNCFIREYTSQYYEYIYYKNTLHEKFDITDNIIQSNCKTISVLLCGIAIVMGARRILIAGMDGYIHIGTHGNMHFYNEENEKNDKKMILNLHRWCEQFLGQINNYLIEQGKEEIHIVTPTAYKSFYKGIDNFLKPSFSTIC